MCTSCFFCSAPLPLYHLSCSTSPNSKHSWYPYTFIHSSLLCSWNKIKISLIIIRDVESYRWTRFLRHGEKGKLFQQPEIPQPSKKLSRYSFTSSPFSICLCVSGFLVWILFIADIQGAISKINPEIIKSVIASGSAGSFDSKKPSISLPSTPKDEPNPLPALPLYRHIPRYMDQSFLAFFYDDNLFYRQILTLNLYFQACFR